MTLGTFRELTKDLLSTTEIVTIDYFDITDDEDDMKEVEIEIVKIKGIYRIELR